MNKKLVPSHWEGPRSKYAHAKHSITGAPLPSEKEKKMYLQIVLLSALSAGPQGQLNLSTNREELLQFVQAEEEGTNY